MSNVNFDAARAAELAQIKQQQEVIAKRNEEAKKKESKKFVSNFDRLGNPEQGIEAYKLPHYAMAEWLWNKGYGDLFDDGYTTWEMVEKRIVIAQPYANTAAQAIADFIGGKVTIPDKEFSQPQISINDGDEQTDVSLFESKKFIESSSEDSPKVKETKDYLMTLWQKWMDYTIPSFTKVAQYNLWPELLKAERARKALMSTTKLVNDLAEQNRAELYRSYAVALNKQDKKLACLVAKQQNRDSEEFIKALGDMTEDEIRNHLIAEAIDSFYKVSIQGCEFHSLAFEDGLPFAPSDKQLDDYAEKARNQVPEWNWNFIFQFYQHLVELGYISYSRASKFSGLRNILVENMFSPEDIFDLEEEAIRNAISMKDNTSPCGFYSKTIKTITVGRGSIIKPVNSVASAFYITKASFVGAFDAKGGNERFANCCKSGAAYAKAIAEGTLKRSSEKKALEKPGKNKKEISLRISY